MQETLSALNSEEEIINPFESELMNTCLEKYLVRNNFIDQDVIDQFIDERNSKIDDNRYQVEGFVYAIDYKKKKLIIFNPLNKKDIEEIDLPDKNFKFNKNDWEEWGNSYSSIDQDEMQKKDHLEFKLTDINGLVLRENNTSYIYNNRFDRNPSLVLSNSLLFGAIPKIKNSSLPFDLFVSDDKKKLLISNRDLGKVYLFDIDSKTFSDTISYRQAGSNKSINIAVNNDNIYLTDNNSPILSIYSISNKKLDKKNLGLGVLGNLCISPDKNSIFILTIKPDQNLKQIDINSLKEIKNFALKGELFSLGDYPTDLMSISPDNNHLLVMTYLNDPNPYTPVITVIDIEKSKASKRFSIKDETKPINIGYYEENLLASINTTFEKIIIENKLMSINDLRNVKNKLIELRNNLESDEELLNLIIEGDSSFLEKEEGEIENEEDFLEVEAQALEFETLEENLKDEYGAGVRPKKTKHVILSKDAIKPIVEILVGSFWQKTQIDLLEIKDYPDKLNEIAEKVRKKLEYYDLEIVNVPKFYGSYPLESIINREFILEMMDEEESRKRQEVKTAPSNCPNCAAPLLGSWDCNACGFSIEKPEDALRKKLASLDQLSNLQKGNYFIIDCKNGILIELDQYDVPVWGINKDELNLKSITSAFRLSNRNTLILDSDGGNIVEITVKGEIEWAYKPKNPNAKLRNPKGIGVLDNGHLIIADTGNHRVLEVDLDGEIIWEYGKKGIPGNSLGQFNNPSYVQKTYNDTILVTDTGNNRLVEFERSVDTENNNYHIVNKQVFGLKSQAIQEVHSDLILSKPIIAFEDLDSNIIIIDNKRALKIGRANHILWEFNCKNNDEEINIESPERITVLKNKDILISGSEKVIKILPTDENRILFISSIEELSKRTHFSVAKENFKKAKLKHGTSNRYMRKVGDPSDEVIFDEKKEEVKKVNASRYMKKSTDKKEYDEVIEQLSQEEIEGKQKKERLESLIDQKRKETDEKHKDNRPHIIHDKTKELLPLLIPCIYDKEIFIFNREGKVLRKIPLKSSPSTWEITPYKSILINYDNYLEEISLSDKTELSHIEGNFNSSIKLNNGNLLVTDNKSFSVKELSIIGEIVWEYKDKDRFLIPNYANKISSGNILITFSNSHIVKEIDLEGNIIWSFGESKKSGNDQNHLFSPSHSNRINNGNTLITDTKNSRILEINYNNEIVWSFVSNKDIKLLNPIYSTRLKNGNTYIIHSSHKQFLEIDEKGNQVWRFAIS